MPSKAVIDDFLAQKKIALVGVSRDSKQFANMVYRSFKSKGYQLYPVNPHAETLEGECCYSTPADLPETVDGALVMVAPSAAAKAVQQCADAGIRRVWLGNGSVSLEAVALCKERGIAVVDGACPMMFAEPVGFGHACHRFVLKIAGKLPK
ncbi:MAG TPA: CoA-binding protein [Chloroflexota bacterium]|nr:CoA-binding protein [Chloroflexota bacterium]